MGYMSSRERLWTAMQGGIPDAVPVVLRMSSFLNDIYGTGGPLAYLKAVEQYGLDAVFWHHLLPNHTYYSSLLY